MHNIFFGLSCIRVRSLTIIITGTVQLPNSCWVLLIYLIVVQRCVYSEGTSKTVWNDGCQETRYASGRVRRRDARGELVLDAEFAPGVPLPSWLAASAVAVSSPRLRYRRWYFSGRRVSSDLWQKFSVVTGDRPRLGIAAAVQCSAAPFIALFIRTLFDVF